jgi:two-component system response regulator
MDGRTMILLVEDNEDDEALTLRALEASKITSEIIVARTGEDALDFLFGTGSHAGRGATSLPQLMLLDLNLPKIDGLAVLRRIRSDERVKLLPVVILTSSKEDEDVIRSYSLGANSYVRKPVGLAAFTDAVKALGLFWLVLNQLPSRYP